MMANTESHTTPQWQTFNVVGGAISRNKAGQVEGILELAPGIALTFMYDPDGVHWTWLPEEPNFVPDESVDYNMGNAA